MRRTNRYWALALPVLLAGCATNPAPSGLLPSAVESRTSAFGGWIELRYPGELGERETSGELIAASRDSLWVLSDSGGFTISTRRIVRGQLMAYDPHAGALTGWAALGTLSTLSNGVFLVFTAPLWLVSGTAATVSEVHAARHKVNPALWPDLAKYARFPQGMPPDLPLASLQPRPRH